jgi:hypothetical protein
MIFNFYSVYDKLAVEYSPPAFLKNDALALRMFNNFLVGVKSSPDDFSLFCLGAFDSDSGRIDSLPSPLLVTVVPEDQRGL